MNVSDLLSYCMDKPGTEQQFELSEPGRLVSTLRLILGRAEFFCECGEIIEMGGTNSAPVVERL